MFSILNIERIVFISVDGGAVPRAHKCATIGVFGAVNAKKTERHVESSTPESGPRNRASCRRNGRQCRMEMRFATNVCLYGMFPLL